MKNCPPQKGNPADTPLRTFTITCDATTISKVSDLACNKGVFHQALLQHSVLIHFICQSAINTPNL